ncbi:serine/threonine-protein kinase [Kibdelosporangium philippinense]|uniref:non-specific serine/threonine protein kinase n=1 Tax=Kibdelosporangium philippinense TaxID=211113 RepID=A0ABS8ZAQ0_9PSEU|nr:FHA domain-containing serine/threonine-protein kinase [Kibdelosporangium philippinense]MCE7003761.1 serine/threonine-protein kinase [Kibdelosporangium philippinense]
MTVIISVRDGGSTRAHRFTEPGTCVIGRADECAITIADNRVSRRHCQLEIAPPRVSIVDLVSRNGTFVNGQRVDTERELVDGDEIRFGGVSDIALRIAVESVPSPFPGYEVLHELGRGAQGTVHLARHDSGELVALKVMTAHASVDENARFGFQREYDSIRALRHPNIVEFHGNAVEGNDFWFAVEYCPDGDLDSLVARRGPLPVEEALSITMQILDGLSYAHAAPVPIPGGVANGLVHRDVKPHNVLLTGSTVKLADFGLAKAFEHAGLSGYTRTGAFGGSIPFVPRTQLVGYRDAKPEVDVWAAAACLYWMLTGATPRDFPPDADPVLVALRTPVVPVRERLSSLDCRLARVIDEALVDWPVHSITSAEELARALA